VAGHGVVPGWPDLERAAPARSGAEVAGLGARRAGSEGTRVALGSSGGDRDAGRRAMGVASQRAPQWCSRRRSSAPTAPGGEARVEAAAWLGGNNGLSWRRRLVGGGSGERAVVAVSGWA
jgi:hypothetical protein